MTSRLGRITPAGQITTLSVPLFDGLPFVQIVSLTAGPDGNLWFPEGNGPGIARVTTH